MTDARRAVKSTRWIALNAASFGIVYGLLWSVVGGNSAGDAVQVGTIGAIASLCIGLVLRTVRRSRT